MSMSSQTRTRAMSHAEYIESLHRPSVVERQQIESIQRQRESEIDRKYHTTEEHEAATTIQKAYRGHRARRELNGLTLDPSTRWVEALKELKFRSAAAAQCSPGASRVGADGRPLSPSETARSNWLRLGHIAEYAGSGESPEKEHQTFLSVPGESDRTTPTHEATTMLMDQRYFLEMVDQKHRYGANLLVYHEEWLRSNADQNFFHWLDHGDGKHLSLPGCSREQLEKERIRYLSKDERKDYLVRVDDEGKLRWQKNNELITTSVEQFKDSMTGIVPKENADAPSFHDKSVTERLAESRRFARRMVRGNSGSSPYLSDTSVSSDSDEIEGAGSSNAGLQIAKKKSKKLIHASPATILNHLLRASIKPGTWIYVADTIGRLYVGIKASGAFQHASFLSGARISSAGSIGIEDGRLVYLSPLSGHYRPTTKSFRVFIESLQEQGVDLSHLRRSKAFKVLLGMEYYGRMKKHVKHKKQDKDERRKSPAKGPAKSPNRHHQSPNDQATLSGTAEVEQNWDKEHRRGLGKMMDGLHIRRRSSEGKPASRESMK